MPSVNDIKRELGLPLIRRSKKGEAKVTMSVNVEKKDATTIVSECNERLISVNEWLREAVREKIYVDRTKNY